MSIADPILRSAAATLDGQTRDATLLHAFPGLAWCADAHGACTFVNQAWTDYTGREGAECRGTGWLDAVHPDDRAGLAAAWDEARGVRRRFEHEYRLRRADGAFGRVRHVAVPVHDADGRLTGYVGACHDVSEQRAAEAALRESEERMRRFAEATHAGIVFHADDGLVSDCNDAILDLLGLTRGQFVGSHLIAHVAPDRREAAAENLRSAFERPHETEVLDREGARIPVEFEGRILPYEGSVCRLSVVRDIRRRKEARARIDHLAHHDLLTDLPNRALLHERLEFLLAAARRNGHQVALLFIDLDHFKTVNDSLGHGAGDELLKIIARRIQGTLRGHDVVSRHGGDEFIVVLPEIAHADASVPVADKLIAAVAEPVELEGQSISVSPSIGISIFPRDGENADVLIRNADAAMYLAKERGRAGYQFFNQHLSAAAFRALSLETLMRESLRDGAFQLYYQPQLDARTGAVTAMEALLRWPQGEGVFIEPRDFVPVAEQRGLMRQIGAWVLREACRQNREWQRAGLPAVPVAVNVSLSHLRSRDLVEQVRMALAETGLEGRFLAFELTESVLTGDVGELARTLEGLKRLGARIVIDDFGRGHASLMHLKRLPIDQLKIDRAFVRDMPEDEDDVAIAAAIVDLARHLGIVSVGKGVERPEQLLLLRERGCDEVQGFLFARPMSADVAARWLARPRTGILTQAS
jgi:diguanylate cyclase (GGDEF)-like protein/PAS domain S-box-containing protein